QLLCVVGTVVAADARSIAPDDEVGAAVVAANQSMEDRFSWTCIPHRRWEAAQHDALARIVLGEEHLVTAHAHVDRHVVVLGGADERMDQDAVGALERHLGQILVRAVDRVAGLESDHGAPTALLELRAAAPWGPRPAVA